MSGWSCGCGATNPGGVKCARCERPAPWYTPPPVHPLEYRPLPVKGLDIRGKALAAAIVLIVLAGFVRIDWVVRVQAERIEAEFQRAVADLSAWVAAERGRPFVKPVEARLLDDDDFLALFADPAELAPEGFTATMYALGLADAFDDVDALAEVAFDASVVGVYSKETKALYVRGREVTPYVRLVLVHELTHAWQDQHHDLVALGDRAADTDQDFAISALVEGDATRVEEIWRAEQSAEDRAAIARAEQLPPPRRAPARAERTMNAMGTFPYVIGARFVTALHAGGGNAAVDAAFAEPPQSTEQVMHPERYLRRDRPRAVPQAEAPVEPIDEGVLGELGLALFMGRGDVVVGALAAARGWDGDAYVTWDDGVRLCTVMSFVFDSRAARDRALARLRTVVTEEDPLEEAPKNGLTVRSCVGSRR